MSPGPACGVCAYIDQNSPSYRANLLERLWREGYNEGTRITVSLEVNGPLKHTSKLDSVLGTCSKILSGEELVSHLAGLTSSLKDYGWIQEAEPQYAFTLTNARDPFQCHVLTLSKRTPFESHPDDRQIVAYLHTRVSNP
jgi:hypothetical protein